MPLCSMAWNPSKYDIAFCDCKGYLGLIENATIAINQGTKQTSSLSKVSMLDEDDAEISISQLKKETGFMISEEDGHDVFTGVRASAVNTFSKYDTPLVLKSFICPSIFRWRNNL